MSITAEHEGLVELFKNRLDLGPAFLQALSKVKVKRGTKFEVENVDLTEIVPTEYNADLVIAFREKERCVGALIVEVQRGRDDQKRFAWPQYITALRARLRCPVYLLVVATSKAVAKWCALPIELGPSGFCLSPLVLGPTDIPAIKDKTKAKSVEMAVLSAIVHGGDRQHAKETAICALEMTDQVKEDRLILIYYNLILGALPVALRKAIEKMVIGGKIQLHGDITKKHYIKGHEEGREEGFEEGEERGEQKGRAEQLLKQLKIKFKRGVTKKVEARVRGATIEQLDVYAERILKEDTLKAVLSQD